MSRYAEVIGVVGRWVDVAGHPSVEVNRVGVAAAEGRVVVYGERRCRQTRNRAQRCQRGRRNARREGCACEGSSRCGDRNISRTVEAHAVDCAGGLQDRRGPSIARNRRLIAGIRAADRRRAGD